MNGKCRAHSFKVDTSLISHSMPHLPWVNCNTQKWCSACAVNTCTFSARRFLLRMAYKDNACVCVCWPSWRSNAICFVYLLIATVCIVHTNTTATNWTAADFSKCNHRDCNGQPKHRLCNRNIGIHIWISPVWLVPRALPHFCATDQWPPTWHLYSFVSSNRRPRSTIKWKPFLLKYSIFPISHTGLSHPNAHITLIVIAFGSLTRDIHTTHRQKK